MLMSSAADSMAMSLCLPLPMSSPERHFDELVQALLDKHADVAPPEPGKASFGSNGAKVNGKIFAMLVRGRLVLRLPKDRVDALVASADGERFDPRHDGRVMREWLVLAPASKLDWQTLASEALAFTRTKR
jgi:hypothetical protein